MGDYMTTREFLEEELCKILVREKQALRQGKKKKEEVSEQGAKIEAGANIKYIYDTAAFLMDNDPCRFLPSGKTLSQQTVILDGWRQDVAKWGNLPELEEAILKADKKLSKIKKYTEFFFPLKSRQSSRVPMCLALHQVTEILASYTITWAPFWAAGVLAESGYPISVPADDFVQIYTDSEKSGDDKKLREIYDRMRHQNIRTKKMLQEFDQEKTGSG
jgi:hypothetical protein